MPNPDRSTIARRFTCWLRHNKKRWKLERGDMYSYWYRCDCGAGHEFSRCSPEHYPDARRAQ